MGKQIVRGAAKEDERLANRVEIFVGTQASELTGAIPALIRAPGLVVMPVEGLAQAPAPLCPLTT